MVDWLIAPLDLTLVTLIVTCLLHGLWLEGELTFGFLRNVQVVMQRDMANILSVGSVAG